MSQRRQPGIIRESADQEMRDQEVLRATRELAAYFRGRRTEREARAALKIIKAFIRGRERMDARSRPRLPGAAVTRTPKEGAKPQPPDDGGKLHRRKARRQSHGTPAKSAAVIEPNANPESPQSSASGGRTVE